MIVMGIDGGGTKTDAVIIDNTRRVLGMGLGGASNTSFTTDEDALKAFVAAMSQALAGAGIAPTEIAAVGSTFSSPVEDAMAALGMTQAKSLRQGEHQVALERIGVEDPRGVAVISGTGSSIWGSDGASNQRIVGGWGAVLGDDGSAYEIGRSGIRRVLMAADGRKAPTALTAAMCDYFNIEHPRQVTRHVVGLQVKQALIAGFATRIGEVAASGDEAAIEIVEQAGEDLGEIAAFVARQFFADEDVFPVALSGGVFAMGSLVVAPLRAVVVPQFPRAQIRVAEMRPGEAVARLALRRMQKEDFVR